MRKKKPQPENGVSDKSSLPDLTWQRAAYQFHTFAYRDPRSAFASGTALPVVSPTTVLLGVVSTLFSIGEAEQANQFFSIAHKCEVIVDAPDGIVFFRAFHQLRRYETLKYGANPKFGLTKINQGTREYGLVEGDVRIFIGVPQEQAENVRLALTNLRHLGTHDSLCSLVSPVGVCEKPKPEEVLYLPSKEVAQELRQQLVKIVESGVTMVTLSRFTGELIQRTLKHWHMTGGQDTELIAYAIPGIFEGTTRGKIYRKRR